MTISDTKDTLIKKGFTLSYSGYEGMIMDNHDLKMRVIIWRDSNYLKFTKQYDAFEKPLVCNYQTSRDFLLEDKIDPIAMILDQMELAFKKATLQA